MAPAQRLHALHCVPGENSGRGPAPAGKGEGGRMSTPQLSLFASEPPTAPCYYEGCNGKAVLGPERYNAAGTCMNQTATCQSCGRWWEISHNLMLTRERVSA